MKKLIKFSVLPVMLLSPLAMGQADQILDDGTTASVPRCYTQEDFSSVKLRGNLNKEIIRQHYKSVISENPAVRKTQITRKIESNNRSISGGRSQEYYLKKAISSDIADKMRKKYADRIAKTGGYFDSELDKELRAEVKRAYEHAEPLLEYYRDPLAIHKMDEKARQAKIQQVQGAINFLGEVVGIYAVYKTTAVTGGVGIVAAKEAKEVATEITVKVVTAGASAVAEHVLPLNETNLTEVMNEFSRKTQKESKAALERQNTLLEKAAVDPNSLSVAEALELTTDNSFDLVNGDIHLNSTDADFEALHFSSLTKVRLEETKATAEKNHKELLELSANAKENSGKLTKLSNEVNDLIARDEEREKAAKEAQKYADEQQSYQNRIGALELTEQNIDALGYYTTMALGKSGAPEDAIKIVKAVVAVNKAYVQIKKAHEMFLKMKGSKELLDGFKGNQKLLDGMAGAALSFNYIQIGMAVVGALMDRGPTPEEMILEGIGDIKKQLADFQENVNDRFNDVDQKLGYIHNDMLSNFDAIHVAIKNQDLKLDTIKARLENLLFKVEQLDANIYEIGASIGDRVGDVLTKECGAEERGNLNLESSDKFTKCFNGLVKRGTVWASDNLSVKQVNKVNIVEMVGKLEDKQADLYVNFLAEIVKYIPTKAFSTKEWATLSNLRTNLENYEIETGEQVVLSNQFLLRDKDTDSSDENSPMVNQELWFKSANQILRLAQDNPEKLHLLPISNLQKFNSEGRKLYHFQAALATPDYNDNTGKDIIAEKKTFWTNLVDNYTNAYSKLFSALKEESKNYVVEATNNGQFSIFEGESGVVADKTIHIPFCEDKREHGHAPFKYFRNYHAWEKADSVKWGRSGDKGEFFTAPNQTEIEQMGKEVLPAFLLDQKDTQLIPDGLLRAKKMGLVDLNLCLAEDTWEPTSYKAEAGKEIVDKFDELMKKGTNKNTTNITGVFTGSLNGAGGEQYWQPGIAASLYGEDVGLKLKTYRFDFDRKYFFTGNCKFKVLSGQTWEYKKGNSDKGGTYDYQGSCKETFADYPVKEEIFYSGAFDSMNMVTYGRRKMILKGFVKDKNNINGNYQLAFAIEVKKKTPAIQAGIYAKRYDIGHNRDNTLSVIEYNHGAVIERFNEFETNNSDSYKLVNSIANKESAKAYINSEGNAKRDLEKMFELVQSGEATAKLSAGDYKELELHYNKLVTSKLESLKQGYYVALSQALSESDGALKNKLTYAQFSFELLRKLTKMGFQGTFASDPTFRAPFMGDNGIPDPYTFVRPLLERDKIIWDPQRKKLFSNLENSTAYDSPGVMGEKGKQAIELAKQNFENYYNNYFVKIVDETGEEKVIIPRDDAPVSLGQIMSDLLYTQRVVELEKQNAADLPNAVRGIREVVHKKSEELGLRVAN